MGNLNILQPYTARSSYVRHRPGITEVRSVHDKENLKSLICDLLLAFIIFPLRAVCVYELIRRIN